MRTVLYSFPLGKLSAEACFKNGAIGVRSMCSAQMAAAVTVKLSATTSVWRT